MRIAVIADIHANLPALRAVIDDVTAHRLRRRVVRRATS